MANHRAPSFFADVLNSVVLTGLSTATNAALTATDSIIAALGKLQAQLNTKAGLINPQFQGAISNISPNGGLEMGDTTTPNTPYLDFHSSGNAIDFDSRIIASGGNATVGQGGLTVSAGSFTVPTPPANSNNNQAATTAWALNILTRQAAFFPDPTLLDATGTNDCWLAIQTAINSCSTAGGGTIWLPYGTYRINSTLFITKSNVKIKGAGHGAFHDVSPYAVAGTFLVWGGAVGGTMVAMTPTPTASSQKLTGCAFEDVCLIGSPSYVTAGAAYGLIATSVQHSEFDLYTVEFTIAALAFTCVTGPIAEAANCEGNKVRLRFRQQNQSGTALQLSGSAYGNACFNDIDLVYGYLNNGIGIDFQDCDNNVVKRAWLDRIVGGTGSNVYFRTDAGMSSVGACARVNTIQHLSGSVHSNVIYAEGWEKAGTSTPSFGNRVEYWDNSNASIHVVLGTGAVFFYNNNTSPIGLRDSTVGVYDGHYQLSDGRIEFWSETPVLGGGTISTITVPFSTSRILNVMAVPYAASPVGTVSAFNWDGRSDGAVNKFDVYVQFNTIVTYRGVALA